MCYALLPLLRADLRMPWFPCISVADVSKSGIGICAAPALPEDMRSLGVWHERWRYRRLPVDQWSPRDRLLSKADAHLSDLFVCTNLAHHDYRLPDMIENELFPEVPDPFMKSCKWRVLTSKPVFAPEPIHALEARAVIHRVGQLC